MYCPSCGTQISVELKYCNRCGANLSVSPADYSAPVAKPIRVTLPLIILGFILTGGIGIIFGGTSELAKTQLHPNAIAWIVIFSMATLFGRTALILRIWLTVLKMNRESYQQQNQRQLRPPVQPPVSHQQLPPRFEPVPSVTEHTTRTFSPAYREKSDPGSR